MATKNALDFTLDDADLEEAAKAQLGPVPVPVGRYNVIITDVAIAPWKRDEPIDPKTGKPVREKLVLTIKISAGEHTGRQFRFVNVPLFKKFPPTAKSPDGTVTAFLPFLKAVGALNGNKVTLKNWNELFGKEVNVKIVVNPPNDAGAVYNGVNPFADVWKEKDDDIADADADADGITFDEGGFSL